MLDQAAPDFTLPATGDQTLSLSALQGKKVVLYFYPKDSTPGCTTESQQFRDLNPEFLSAGTVVLGISRDSVRSHENFRIKQSLPFDLVSDPEETACTLFGVMKMKNMYGKQVRGIERSTFVIDAAGILRREWRGVKVPGHAQEVLDYIKTL
jgi:thioredoxin-dependent peroxiredoxin